MRLALTRPVLSRGSFLLRWTRPSPACGGLFSSDGYHPSGRNKLDLIYSDPSIKDPGAASASLRAQLAGLYTRQSQLDPLAESILQEQVSAMLADQD